MMTVAYGGTYKKAAFVPCPAQVTGDGGADSYLSAILSRTGPLPPGLEVGLPIRCRNDKGDPIIRVPFYGVPFTLYGPGGVVASMESLYYHWVERFKTIANRMLENY